MDDERHNPEYWLQFPPDNMVGALLSEFVTFAKSVQTVYHILQTNNATKDIKLMDDLELRDYISGHEKYIEDVKFMILAAGSWKDAYREGKINLGDYPKPKFSAEDETKE